MCPTLGPVDDQREKEVAPVFGLLYLLGWFGTAALIARLWTRRHSRRSAALATLVGLAVGLVWPITLWIAVGVWWRHGAASASTGASATLRMPSLGGTVAVCAAGSVMTFVGLGAAAPPPAPSTAPSSSASPVTPTATPTPRPAAMPASSLVDGVVDGDTVDLSDGRRVRLLGIDVPERGECGYEEATEFARASLMDRPVQITADPTQAETDPYGRALLYLGAPQGYSTAAAGAGWAEHYVFNGAPVQKAPQIEAAQQTAQTQRLGIWGSLCAPAPTSAPATTQPAPPAARDDNNDRDPGGAAPGPQRQAQPQPQPEPQPEPEPAAESDCHPSYVPCVPNGPVNCPVNPPGVSGDL